MNALKAILSWFGMTFAGMYGGQKDKQVRRIGLPLIAEGFGLSVGWSWKYLAFLLFIPILYIGYGVDSILGAWLGHVEWLIRLSYALLLSLPFAFFGVLRWVCAASLLMVSFQIHAGSFGHFWGMDWLIEDVIRYGTLALLVIYNILRNKRASSASIS